MLGALIGAGASLLGGVLTNNSNRKINSANNAYNAAEAEKQRDFESTEAKINREWQNQQTSTAYQRAVTDMQKAGLNPMLAYSQGGAQSGSGSAARGSTATAQTPIPMQNVISSALQGAQVYQNVLNTAADTEKKTAEAGLARTSAETQYQQGRLNSAQTTRSGAETDHINVQIANTKQMLDNLKQQNLTEYQKTELTKVDTQLRRLDRDVRTHEVSTASAITTLRQNEAKLAGLKIPRAENEAAAEETWFKGNVSPFTDDIYKLSNSAGQLSRLLPPKILLDTIFGTKKGHWKDK